MPDLLRLPAFDGKHVLLVVETPRGSAAKFSYEPETHTFGYSHPLPLGVAYPYDWGFIPSTLGDDGDALDGLVVHRVSSPMGVVIKCHVLGFLRLEQSEGDKTSRNDRHILCPVGAGDEAMPNQVPQRLQREIQKFLLASVVGTAKKLKFKGWGSRKDALEALRKGQKRFLQAQSA